MRAMTAAIIAGTIENLNLQWPTITDEDRSERRSARRARSRAGVTCPVRSPDAFHKQDKRRMSHAR
jgi:hypothetical protein